MQSLVVTLYIIIIWGLYLLLTRLSKKVSLLNPFFILLLCNSIIILPSAHYIIYKMDSNNYYFQDYFNLSIRNRLTKEKIINQYDITSYKIVTNTLQKESDSILANDSNVYFKNDHLKYLDSLLITNKDYSRFIPHKPIGIPGGGIKEPPIFLTLYKDNKVVRMYYGHDNIKNILLEYTNEFKNYKKREIDLVNDVNYWDFFLASVSLFKFNEIIPNSVLSKIFWLIQAASSFIFLFYLSQILSAYFKDKKP